MCAPQPLFWREISVILSCRKTKTDNGNGRETGSGPGLPDFFLKAAFAMKQADNKKKRLFDLLLIGGILILAAVLLVVVLKRQGAEPEDGACAVVLIDGEEAARYPLSKNGSFPLNGGTNTLVIEDGYAWMTDSDCPDKICEHMGKIHLNGQLIVCLPNGVIVTVEGGDDGGVDIFG